MHVDTMRRLDRWIGIPVVGLLAGLHRLRRLVAAPARRQPIRRILFIELSEMGSAILVDPAMRRARTLYPQAQLYFLIFARNAPSLDILGTIGPEQRLRIRDGNLLTILVDTLATVWRLRRLDLDLVIDLELFSRYTSALSLLSGAPFRVGFHRFHNEGLYRGDHLTHPVQYNPHQHMAKNFLALVHAAAEEDAVRPHTKRRFEDEETRLAPYRDEIAAAALRDRLIAAFPPLANLRKWVIINPNASELLPLRRWPLDNYGRLAARLLEDPELAILITGAASEKPDAQHVIRMAPSDRIVDLTGFTRLHELPPLYMLCAAMVTNDSGPAHFAAPTGIKTWVLFGPETPALYGALNPNAEFIFKGLSCSPCVSASNHRASPCTDNQCMKQISVEEVYARMRAYLATDAGAGTAGSSSRRLSATASTMQ